MKRATALCADRGRRGQLEAIYSYEHTAETLNLDDPDRFDTTLQHASESHLALVKPEAPLANSPTGTVQETADREPVRQLPFSAGKPTHSCLFCVIISD